MRPDKIVTTGLLFSVCLTVTARGQASPPEPGTRVRLTIPCFGDDQAPPGQRTARCRLEGTLVRMAGDSIKVRLVDTTISHAWTHGSRLEVSHGHHTYWLAGAGIGFLAGAGATWLLINAGGSTSLCDRSANQDALGSTECFGLVVLGGVSGGGVGALIGNAIRGERWQDFPLGQLRVGLAPARPGIGISWNVTF